VSDAGRTHLAVLGSPISHSKSPAIHRAAYAVLGLEWIYDSAEVTGGTLAEYVATRGASWRGLSLTMPLKRDILPLLDWRDPLVDRVGGANTVLFADDGLRGFNTDVQGTVRSFEAVGVTRLDSVLLLGAGATAASVLVAVGELGATGVVVSARTPAKGRYLIELGEREGVAVEVVEWGTATGPHDAVVSTLPGGQNDLLFPEAMRSGSVLFDVAYDPWPSELARQWDAAGGTVISGLDLLINQAVGQIRIFTSGDQHEPLPREDAVVAAMRSAVAAPS
jgi:shikimate dehydrogenase